MQASHVNGWGLTLYSSPDGTKPVAAMGASVTPAQNAYGAYVQLFAALPDDCWEITICVNSVGISASARDCLVSLGVDPSGGSSFVSLADLVCGPASSYLVAAPVGGVSFRFPLRIKAGSSVGVAASVNSATLTAIAVFARIRSRPTRPELVRAGEYIDQFGVTPASSSGTAITPGGVAEGAFTQIGTLARPCWFWEFGYGVNNATMQLSTFDVDIAIGDNANKTIVIPNAPVFDTNSESLTKPRAGEYFEAAAGQNAYARSQAGGTIEGGHSVAIYGVGG